MENNPNNQKLKIMIDNSFCVILLVKTLESILLRLRVCINLGHDEYIEEIKLLAEKIASALVATQNGHRFVIQLTDKLYNVLRMKTEGLYDAKIRIRLNKPPTVQPVRRLTILYPIDADPMH